MESTREDPFIKLFISVYESGSWATANCRKQDAIDRKNPAVDLLATRKSDGRTLAIEHTIIEPFAQEKEDFAAFANANYAAIEADSALRVPGTWIEVFVPFGATLRKPSAMRENIVASIHGWLKENRLRIPAGLSHHSCPIIGSATPAEITLVIRVVPLVIRSNLGSGIIQIRRQQIESNLGNVIDKALMAKLPKLVKAPVDKRILLLERQHINLLPNEILNEIESKRDQHPHLAKVDEIWILETIFYDTSFGEKYLRFERYEKDRVVQSYDFQGEKLLTRFENGTTEVVNHLVG